MFATYLRIALKRARLVRGARVNQHTETLWGQHVSFPDYEAFAILFEEIYLPGVYFFRPTRPRPHIIDCGANIGVAVAFFLTHYPNARIVAFEPDDEAFAVLSMNRDRNGWADVELHHTAVHRSEGAQTFYSYSAGSLVSGFRRAMSGSEPTRVTEIPTVRLSSYIDRPVDLLKLDVEGSEIAVFEDLAETDKLGLVEQIIMEYHHHTAPGEDRLGYLLNLLEQHGFGYDLRAIAPLPFVRGRAHNFMMYAYRK